MIRLLVVMPVMAVLACGGDLGGNTFNGTIGGVGFSPRDAISAPFTIRVPAPINAAMIMMIDAEGLCARATANQNPRSARTLQIFLGDLDPVTGAASPPAGTGTFIVHPQHLTPSPTHVAEAWFSDYGATCQGGETAKATSGTVTLTANTGSAYEGTFDMTFHSDISGDEHATGSFTTSNCPGLINYSDDHMPACE